MGQTYVYNSGEYEVSDDEIEVTFGVFIDGTLNNKDNTDFIKTQSCYTTKIMKMPFIS